MKLAPIALFVYNRPTHTERTLSALSKNERSSEHIIYIFVDGLAKEEDSAKQDAVMLVLAKYDSHFKQIDIIKRPQNLGVDDSIFIGVSHVLSLHDKVIVLEDDIVTAKGFLTYMNHYLSTYQNDDSIYSICGFSFPLNISDFAVVKTLGVTGIWGWATWSRAWSGFERDGSLYYEKLMDMSQNEKDRFNFFGGYNYQEFLHENARSMNNCWDIQWYAYTYTKGKYCLSPTMSLVRNIGHDGTGVHSHNTSDYDTNIFVGISYWPEVRLDDSPLIKKMSRYLKRITTIPIMIKFKRLIKFMISHD
jgi:hypothetical protein